jgi:hypothetical protein
VHFRWPFSRSCCSAPSRPAPTSRVAGLRRRAVRELWSEPAFALGLPLLAAIYEHGFYYGNRWAGPVLQQVLNELARLEPHWSSAGLPAEVLADLRERAGYLRTAIALAEECDGFVDIA